MKKALFILFIVSLCSYSHAQTWVPLYTGSSIRCELETLNKSKGFAKLENGTTLDLTSWDRFFRTFILKFPPSKGDSILNGLLKFQTIYDRVEKLIRFEPKVSGLDSYVNNSHIAFSGYIKDKQIYPFLKINYTGQNWNNSIRIKMVCDDDTFEFDSLYFQKVETNDMVSEFTMLPFDENVLKLVLKIINSKETIIRFYGESIYSDLEVTDKMKHDLKEFLPVIRAFE